MIVITAEMMSRGLRMNQDKNGDGWHTSSSTFIWGFDYNFTNYNFKNKPRTC